MLSLVGIYRLVPTASGVEAVDQVLVVWSLCRLVLPDLGLCACKEVWLVMGYLVNYRARNFEVPAETRTGASLCGCEGFVPYAVNANISHLKDRSNGLSYGLLVY
ncbi:hypothetical protein RHGRI_002881 [Rhododendron griersonianum]|uniref:Uncharacterized protein n=1 Tax=Rhododendron griersonianum TaxID=479676 RepID=A0AAV6LTF2_9ERIC|nr:hypothetical protein RHGRI_002881 [Rhododendron griersonianum]